MSAGARGDAGAAYTAPVRIETGEVDGPLEVTDELHLMGMARGRITVRTGGRLHLGGTALDGLEVEAGGEASILGTLQGPVHNAGRLEVSGIVRGRISTGPGATTDVAPKAIVVDQATT